MSDRHSDIARRDFLKTLGAVGIGSALMTDKIFAELNEPNTSATALQQTIKLPKRKLGKTGVEISCLTFGLVFDAIDNQTALRKALQWGVTCWDTSYTYGGGNSELGIGKFLLKNPDVRKQLFLITKASGAEGSFDQKKDQTPQIEKLFRESLQRMKVDYIDCYCGVHGLSDPKMLNDRLKAWAKEAKQRKLIRFFGFSTHANMAECLLAASKLDWIDIVMTIYNFRVMQDKKLQDAVQACYDAGIGIIAMKTLGKEVEPKEDDKKLVEHFTKRGFTEGQAKVKLVLEDKRIASVAVGRENILHLAQNVAAAMDKTSLTQTDRKMLDQYARQTGSGYCAGCANICDSAAPDVPCISDIMRSLMYHNSYGDKELARQAFAQIPDDVRSRLLSVDYRAAEAHCPQRMPIAHLIAQAVAKLA